MVGVMMVGVMVIMVTVVIEVNVVVMRMIMMKMKRHTICLAVSFFDRQPFQGCPHPQDGHIR